jgi:hypothetical protein
MAGEFSAKVIGIEDAAAELRALPPKLRKRAIMNALRAAGRLIRQEVRAATPVLQIPVRRKGRLIRQPGTVRKAVSVRTSRLSAQAGDLGVFINVKPAKGLNKGRYNPFDPFYWKFLPAFKRGGVALQAGAGKLREALAKFEATLKPAIEKLNRPKAPAP